MRDKSGKFLKGHRSSPSTEFKVGSQINLGHKHSEETKKKISLKSKGKTSPMKGKKHTLETREKMRQFQLQYFSNKENHPHWKGGISRDRHGGKENREWRAKVFERDNWTCQTCHTRGVYLEAHHVKSWANFPEFRFILENGVTLCRECHKLTDNYKFKGRNKYA